MTRATMAAATVNGVNIAFRVQGKGPPLVLIMGYRLSSAAWPARFVDALAEHFTVVTFDNRGTGQSDKPLTGYALANMARDVAGLLDEIGIESTYLLGYSMGGAIAQEFTRQFPERVAGLILCATMCGGGTTVRRTSRSGCCRSSSSSSSSCAFSSPQYPDQRVRSLPRPHHRAMPAASDGGRWSQQTPLRCGRMGCRPSKPFPWFARTHETPSAGGTREPTSPYTQIVICQVPQPRRTPSTGEQRTDHETTIIRKPIVD